MNKAERTKMEERAQNRKQKALENSISFMSDAKWRKLIASIDEIEHIFSGSKWNLIWKDEIVVEDAVPNSKDIAEKHLLDGQFYYVGYDDIVWLELITNEPDKAINHFSKVASFELHKTESGVKIIGYKLSA